MGVAGWSSVYLFKYFLVWMCALTDGWMVGVLIDRWMDGELMDSEWVDGWYVVSGLVNG